MCKGLRLEGDWDSKDWYPMALIQDHCGWEMNLMVRTELAFKLFDKINIIKNLLSNGLLKHICLMSCLMICQLCTPPEST